MADVPVAIVGAGVVGLAVAARLCDRLPGLLVLERRERHGTETSSRCSEVVHAGINDPPGSLKTTLCVEGNAMVAAMAARHGIPYRRIGKLVVATSAAEEADLDAMHRRATASGVVLQPLDRAAVARIEPSVRCTAALLSPSTGIVDAEALMRHFRAVAAARGATLLTCATVVGLAPVPGGYRIDVARPAGRETIVAERVVNAAGLEADTVAAMAGIDVDAAGYRQHWARGCYFAADSAMAGLVSRLVYPVPGRASLGVHVVLDLAGRLRFGPDIAYLPDRRMDLSVDPALRSAFAAAVRRFLPQVKDTDLTPDMAGIRAKLQDAGGPFRDFVIRQESDRGLPGLVTLAGIESPGLTAAPAIARLVEELLR